MQDTNVILNMLRLQKHRGPDDSGIRAFSLASGESMEMNVQEPEAISGTLKEYLDSTG